MSIFPSLSETERAAFERDGFLVWRSVLEPSEVERYKKILKTLADRFRLEQGLTPQDSVEIRNAIVREPAIMELLDHPRVIGAMRDILGANIQLSTSHVFERLPTPAATGSFKAIDWHADGPNPRPPVVETVNGPAEPRLYAKAGWFLTDLSKPNQGNLRVVPGSHKLAACPPKDENGDPEGAVQVLTEPGDVVLFENRTWHAVGPNYAEHARLNLYMGYCHRWMKPIDFISMPDELMDGANPAQKQLLGAAQDALSFYLPSRYEGDCPLATL
jgi:ectoine hydroxylase-related dioxygenase (phytanoyl-CoA dioxygenase family)